MLELLHVTENRYSGIPTIIREMETAGLPEPVFEVKRGDFIVTLKNNMYDPADEIDRTDLTAALLLFCRTPRTRKEVTEFVGKSRYYVMSTFIQPMIAAGKLAYTIPDKPQSPNQRFVSVEE